MFANMTILEYLKAPSARLQETKLFIWSFVLPPICLVGLITNVLNVVVFYSLRKSKNKLYIYFLVHSACDLVYLLICFVFFVCKTSLSENYSSYYWVVAYEYAFYLCLTTMMATVLVFIELMISLKRIFLVLNFNLTFKIRFRTVLLICSLVAVFVHLPMPIALYVKETKAATFLNGSQVESARYELAYDRIRQSAFYQFTFAVPITFRGLVAPVLLLVMTIILYKKLGRQLNRKREMVHQLRGKVPNNAPSPQLSDEPLVENPIQTIPISNEERIQNAKRNLTRMIISINLLFIFANATTYTTTMFIIKIGNKPLITNICAIVSNLVLFTAHAATIFVYYNFDGVFRRKFISCFLGSRK